MIFIKKRVVLDDTTLFFVWHGFCNILGVRLYNQNIIKTILLLRRKNMTTLVRKNQGWLPSVFNDLFEHPLFVQRMPVNTPAINVKETKEEYVVEVAAPGMTKEDFDVRIDEEDYLVITLEKRDEREEKKPKEECGCEEKDKECGREECYLRREFSFSKFQQAMILPDNVDKDKIRAKVKHGVLRIELPKLTGERTKKLHRTIEIL